jgi:hypothetical protein
MYTYFCVYVVVVSVLSRMSNLGTQYHMVSDNEKQHRIRTPFSIN